MSQEDLENLRSAYERFIVTGEFSGQFAPDFVWDMSTFQGWPERQTYEGIEGARTFREGAQVRMRMYASRSEALEAAGLSE